MLAALGIMIITSVEYENLSHGQNDWREIFKSRRAYWPGLIVHTNGVQKKWFVAQPDTYEIMSQQNFWVLSRQYYALSWSLFTLGHPNQILMPYRDNISSKEDEVHQLELRNIISAEGWGFVHFLGLAHISCEMAFKCILLHNCVEANRIPGFPRTHDLGELFNLLDPTITQNIRLEFENWSQSHSPVILDDVLNGSGERFLLQRYGELPAANPRQLGTIDLCRFLHTFIK